MKAGKILPVIIAQFQFSNQPEHLFRFFHTFKDNISRLMFSLGDIKPFERHMEDPLVQVDMRERVVSFSYNFFRAQTTKFVLFYKTMIHETGKYFSDRCYRIGGKPFNSRADIAQ